MHSVKFNDSITLCGKSVNLSVWKYKIFVKMYNIFRAL